MLFRSSEEVKGTGFQMYIICFREEERDPPGIVDISLASIAYTYRNFSK